MALTQVSTEGIKNGTITGTDLATNVDLVDNQYLRLGTGNDLQIYHNGNVSVINDVGTGPLGIRGSSIHFQSSNASKEYAGFVEDGAASLYYANSKKFETTSSGAAVTGELDVSGTIDMNTDTGRLKIGAGDDLQIYHDGTNSYIANNGGELRIWAKTDGYAMVAVPDAQVELYHNNSKKFETNAQGIVVSGDINVTMANGYNFFLDQSGNFLRLGDSIKLQLGNTGDLSLIHI